MDDLQRIFALYESAQLAEAATLCADFVVREPDNAAGWALRGQIALRRGLFPEAVDHLERALGASPGDTEITINLGIALHGAGRHTDAVRVLKQVIKRDPSNAAALLYLGRCRLAAGLLAEAAAMLNAALAQRPDWPDALEAFSALSLAAHKPDKALMFAQRALAGEPGRLSCLELAAYANTHLGDHEAAAAYYREATARADGSTLANLASALQHLGHHDEALSAYDRALQRNPDDPALQHAAGTSLLALGRLAEGWPLHARRFSVDFNAEGNRAGEEPLTAPPKPGMRVIAWADQGIGEQLLFASLIPDLMRTGAEIAVECDYRLVPLLARSFPGVTVCPHTAPAHDALASFTDGRFCLSDAAAWFRQDFKDFPAHHGYLRADAQVAAGLRAKYLAGRRIRQPLVGISWRRADGTQQSGPKSLPLEQWGPILHVAGCTFVNLQYGDTAAQIEAAVGNAGIRILTDPTVDPLIDLDAFAAQVAAMDLVISTSSATAHMAGALGVPAWTFLPKGLGSLWHWFLDRDDSPWYPNMRLFRQTRRGDWDTVLTNASGALADFVENWTPDRT